jgi:hypothetical protein
MVVLRGVAVSYERGTPVRLTRFARDARIIPQNGPFSVSWCIVGVYVSMFVCFCVCVCLCESMYVYLCVYVYACVCVCVCVCVSVCERERERERKKQKE